MKYEKTMLLEVIGDSVENRIIDFLLEGRDMDYGISDIARGCNLSRPTIYKFLRSLIKEQVIKESRKLGRIALYHINQSNERVVALIRLDNYLLKKSFEEVDGHKNITPSL